MDHSYESDIVLGERFYDEQTGIEGVAISVTFFQYGCERVALETVKDDKIEEYCFDAPRLTRVKTGKRAEADTTGGPSRTASHVRPGPARR